MVFWISMAMAAYILIGLAFAVGVYIQEDGDRNDSEIEFDVFMWPLIVLGALLVLMARCTKLVGDWILRMRSAKP